MFTHHNIRGWSLLLSSFFFFCFTICAQVKHPDIRKGDDGQLVYTRDEKGNRIPDFSYCGYMASEKPVPDVPARIFVPVTEGDATAGIQSAIDYVASLKPDKNGFRGAVLLGKGTFSVHGSLQMPYSGVVLRGSGPGPGGTILSGAGKIRQPLINIKGQDNRQYGDTIATANTFVPVNATEIPLVSTKGLKAGDKIYIRRISADSWIKTLEMEEFGGETGWIGWKPGDVDILWDRQITEVNGNTITIDVPLTEALDPQYGPAEVIPYTWTGRSSHNGVENLRLVSAYDTRNEKDEQHRWFGIIMENITDSWVRQVTFEHFAGGAVKLLSTVKKVTVEDCKSLDPVSEIGEPRRYTFYTEGQQTLFQRCYSEYGYHDFAVGGFGTPGPNAFVQCKAYLPYSFSGTIGSWASGVLFDVMEIDGRALSLKNREQAGRGAGWTASNSVFWESSASKIECYSPPTSRNWAFGVWGQFSGNGHWKDVNSHISPRSLYYSQLEERLGELPYDPYIIDLGTEPSSSPTIEQAAELTALAAQKNTELSGWIGRASERNPIPTEHHNIKKAEDLISSSSEKTVPVSRKIQLQNGWLTFGEKLLTGTRYTVQWWRGSLRKREIDRAAPHITRFSPGYTGTGYTDNLDEVVSYMAANNVAGIEHNYGLWYDRRRDDHERVRRLNGDGWPPFYEQPFLRSGEGEAWDRLSKYDLTRYNDWYWNRLKSFADRAEQQGKLLVHQQYFQHNILEAGAHWADSPWRPANNINHTGFPEPPPYAGDKRIFLAEQFYDVNHPVRRELHKQYIRKGLENFAGNSNVIQLTSAEYTGPLHFMEFWLDVVARWEEESGRDQWTGLSATKDVQDAILQDQKRSAVVDIIDIRYWYYKEDGSAYAPPGGKNLAPRQHARKMKTGKETPEQVYRAVREYRRKYPGKAVIYSTPGSGRFGWPVLMAGGSLPAIPEVDLPRFYTALPQMTVEESAPESVWVLQEEGNSYLLYFKDKATYKLNLENYRGNYDLYQVGLSDGKTTRKSTLRGGRRHTIDETDKLIFIVKR
ncbi:DUF6298 domain-containing protein [Sinomicrobium pectinilyticum]|uniref:DUF6298 domain-containing protein n=1 Tax=Sinomicrobium pectinilyticum TaxID=1084421 RepID=UPI001F0C43FE|nr:DUF6298 domain-containing protein [Sinomicrobium pectinilyticum]